MRHELSAPGRTVRKRLASVGMLAATSLMSLNAMAAAPADTALPAADGKLPARGLVMFDYQHLKVDGSAPADLFGFHYLNAINDWLYLGVGGHAPLLKGDYGGLMAFDVTLHAQQRLFGPVSIAAGLSLGGGGGGKNTQQSKILTGTGGFAKGYVGLGYALDGGAVIGVDYSHVRFSHSAVNSAQLGLFVQVPVSYSMAPYASSGLPASREQWSSGGSNPSDDDVLVFGSDNIVQLGGKGTNRRTINLIDVQYEHFVSRNAYALFGGSVGYHGLAGYNQAYGGAGYRYRLSKAWSVQGQVAIGSGGYAPDQFDTGPGLLIMPKVSAEYRLSDDFGFLLSGGTLYAPRGSSRNLTVGAALVYHADGPRRDGEARTSALTFQGRRTSAFLQTELGVKVGDKRQSQLKLLTVQVDTVLGERVYVPIQGSIAYSDFLGYPGFGEVLAGFGMQSRYAPGDSVQGFAQLLLGTNIYGVIVKPALGVNIGLSDRFAVYGQIAGTSSLDGLGVYPAQYRFRSTSVGVGLTYRFALPG